MPIETWVLFVLVSIIPVISPGPGIFLSVSNALHYGPQATFFSSTGNSLGLLILCYLVALGLGSIMTQSVIWFTVIKFLGAGYLIYLGFKAFKDKTFLLIDDNQPRKKRSPWFFVSQGVAVSLTNPKALVLIAALIPTFMTKGQIDLVEISILSFTYAIMCLLFHWFLAVSCGRMRQFLASPERVSLVRRVTGAGFIGFGLSLAAAGP